MERQRYFPIKIINHNNPEDGCILNGKDCVETEDEALKKAQEKGYDAYAVEFDIYEFMVFMK